jgi:esterase/lipase superfamily enzyme
MHREHHRWFSPSLGRDMELLVFGHAGARLLALPTSLGRFYEWQDFGMIGALAEQIERGWVQVYCVDSVDAESWYAKHLHPADRARRQLQYDRYLIDEVLPLTRQRNGNPFLMTAGASFGAYHAACVAFRHPEMFDRVIGLSGLYDIKDLTGGYSDSTVYSVNPSEFLANEHDEGRLAALRRMDIILVTGRDDPNVGNNEYLSRMLWSKGIGNALRIWDGWSHDWPYWFDMMRKYIGGHD